MKRLLVGTLLAGCGAAGTRPHDMSAGRHHARAEALEEESRRHAARSDPGGNAVCGGSTIEGSSPCWSIPSSQAAHEEEARRLRHLAERHRAAGHVLVQAELEVCEGLQPADRDVSPFFHRYDVRSVAKLDARDAGRERHGAVIRFRSVEGLTTEWLDRAVRCHLARAAALGHSPELGYCPLAVRGASAQVASRSNEVEVEVWAADSTTGAEIFKRARALQEAR